MSFEVKRVHDIIKGHKGIESHQDAVLGIVSKIKIVVQKCGRHLFNVVLTIDFSLFFLQGTRHLRTYLHFLFRMNMALLFPELLFVL